ncbi:response regulator transcription factor [Paenibacillus sp. P96]|uniref:Response regulator transcription factor n=1 Tax=Paenibacillus zeirhizosphaerae TaxID=2987519 RepID=A0ABT9FP68_9BACL|nr:response regulator transcription factor [Paenibacillus sp. P96]MDP4096474.1 response regulator transcription factor [Paenibacillus sp. P96]
MIKLLLADDHAMVRKGLQVFLSTQSDIEVVGEASNGAETLEQAALLLPDVILMDLNMPMMDGIAAARELRAAQPQIKVIVMTSFNDRAHVLPAVQAGVKGYLLKDIEPSELAEAIRRVYQGKVELHPDAAGELMRLMSSPDAQGLRVGQNMQDTNPPHHAGELRYGEEPHDENASARGKPSYPHLERLTPREREVLDLIAHGLNNREIAEKLVITEKTVKTHVSHLLDKLELADRTQAAIFALKNGISS